MDRQTSSTSATSSTGFDKPAKVTSPSSSPKSSSSSASPKSPKSPGSSTSFGLLSEKAVWWKWLSCQNGQSLRVKPREPFKPFDKFVHEIQDLPTVVLDVDGTLVHTLVDPTEIAAAQTGDLRTIQLPGKMGLVVERPGLEQLFSSLLGYNVVLYSAGGVCYVNAVVERLVQENPFMQGKICKLLCISDLVRYTMDSEVPSDTPLSTEGVYYVKDLRKAREDGNVQKVLIVDDNEYAFQVHPHMKDANFRKRYNAAPNALPVALFVATDPKAASDTAFAQVGQVLQEIVGMENLLAALEVHPHLVGKVRDFAMHDGFMVNV